MNRKMWLITIAVLGLAGNSAVTADDYSYSGVVTLCTGTCDSFASLTVGSTFTGGFDIATNPGGSFSDFEIISIQLYVFNPALPV